MKWNDRIFKSPNSLVHKNNVLFFWVLLIVYSMMFLIYIVTYVKNVMNIEKSYQKELLLEANSSLSLICQRTEMAISYLSSMTNTRKFFTTDYTITSDNILTLYHMVDEFNMIQYINDDLISSMTFYSANPTHPEYGMILKPLHQCTYKTFLSDTMQQQWIYNKGNLIYCKKNYLNRSQLSGVWVVELKKSEKDIMSGFQLIQFTDTSTDKLSVYNEYLQHYLIFGGNMNANWYFYIHHFIINAVLFITSFFVFKYVVSRLSRKIFENMSLMIQNIENGIHISDKYKIPLNPEPELNIIAYQINSLLDTVRQYVKQNQQLQTERSIAIFNMLQMQTNPHFFCNSLAIIQYKMEELEAYKESDALSNFSRLLRYSLEIRVLSTLREELDSVKQYVAFYNGFQKNPIEVLTSVPEELLCCQFPKVVLQPLVENAVKYGNGETIGIKGYLQEGSLTVEVFNSGNISEEKLLKIKEQYLSPSKIKEQVSENGYKIGLKNITMRLQMLYGQAARMSIQSKNGLVLISVTIPRKKEIQNDPKELNFYD